MPCFAIYILTMKSLWRSRQDTHLIWRNSSWLSEHYHVGNNRAKGSVGHQPQLEGVQTWLDNLVSWLKIQTSNTCWALVSYTCTVWEESRLYDIQGRKQAIWYTRIREWIHFSSMRFFTFHWASTPVHLVMVVVLVQALCRKLNSTIENGG